MPSPPREVGLAPLVTTDRGISPLDVLTIEERLHFISPMEQERSRYEAMKPSPTIAVAACNACIRITALALRRGRGEDIDFDLTSNEDPRVTDG